MELNLLSSWRSEKERIRIQISSAQNVDVAKIPLWLVKLPFPSKGKAGTKTATPRRTVDGIGDNS